MFWKKFTYAFPRNLIIFSGITGLVIGEAWAFSFMLPSVASWLLLLAALLINVTLASLGQAALKAIFNI